METAVNMEDIDKPPKICIVGAGLSGLCMGIKLKTELKIDTFTIYEGCEEVGGTWFVNNYPGCACDVFSHLYSFSFAPKYDWSHSYAPQPEILEYIKDVTKKYDLYPHIRFQTKVDSLRWDDKDRKWHGSILNVKTGKVKQEIFDIVVNGTGKIRIPHYPKEYLDFKGPLLHSAEWDKTISLKGKRVGVVGTGASAVQIITAIADQVDKLTVFQRKAPYIVPRAQIEYSDAVKWAFSNIPGLYRLSRFSKFWIHEFSYTFVQQDSFMNRLGEKFTRWFRNHQIEDPELRKKITPQYTFACKRVILSENYYTTLAKPNVDLVTEKIVGASETAIKTASGKSIDLDVLILATGYQPHDFFSPMKVYGKHGKDILEEWKRERPRGYMGIISHDMPNFFTLLGPYTALGHSSNIFNIECQVQWSILAIKTMMKAGATCMTLKKEAEEEFMQDIDSKFKETVWGNSQCGSWYLDGKGENTTLWPFHQVEFWRRCKSVDKKMFVFE